MENKDDLNYFDTVPHLAELVSRKERLYKIVDSIFKGNEIEYNKYGKESKFYDHPFGDRGSISQKKYYNRVIAIISDPNKGKENMCILINELKKEFPYAYDAVAVRKIKKLGDYNSAFYKKYGNSNVSINDGNDNMLMFCIFSIYLENKYDETNPYFRFFIKIIKDIMESCGEKSYVKIDKEDLKILNNRYKEMAKKLDFNISASMKLYNILVDEQKINKEWIIRYVIGLDEVLDRQQLNLDKVVDKFLTKKEIMELMHICYYTNEEDFYDDEKLSLWLISAGEIVYLAKAYNKAKKIIDENDNEDLLNELRIEKDKYNYIRNKLIALETKADNFEEENKKLYKENERFKLELEELKNIKKEVVS